MKHDNLSNLDQLKFLRDEAARSTVELVATRNSAQRHTLFSVAILGAVVPIFAQEVQNMEGKYTLTSIAMLISAIFFGRAHILYRQVVSKNAYQRYLEILSNRLVGVELFSDPEATRVTGSRWENKINMVVMPACFILLVFFTMYFGLGLSEDVSSSADLPYFQISLFCSVFVLIIVCPIFFRIFSSEKRFEKALAMHLRL